MVIFLVDLPIWRWWFSIVFWDCLLVMGIPKNLVLGMSWQDLEMGTTPLATEASSSVLGGAALLGRLRAPWEIPRWWDVRWYGKRVMLSDFGVPWLPELVRKQWKWYIGYIVDFSRVGCLESRHLMAIIDFPTEIQPAWWPAGCPTVVSSVVRWFRMFRGALLLLQELTSTSKTIRQYGFEALLNLLRKTQYPR